MLGDVGQRALAGLPGQDRAVEQPGPGGEAGETVGIEGCEGGPVLRQLRRHAVEHARLVERASDEEDAAVRWLGHGPNVGSARAGGTTLRLQLRESRVAQGKQAESTIRLPGAAWLASPHVWSAEAQQKQTVVSAASPPRTSVATLA